MDTLGRKHMWMLCLTATAAFTGLTYFAENFWQLMVMRMLASGFAMAELAVSITIVNEQVPARHRGLLYSLVQGGWPLEAFLASRGVPPVRPPRLAGRISPGRHSDRHGPHRTAVHQGARSLSSPPGVQESAGGRRRS